MRAVKLDARRCLARDTTKIESSGFESLCEEPIAIAIPHQDLHSIATPIEEHEEVAAERIVPELLDDDRVKTVEGLALMPCSA